jgi:hypothetical protein
MSRGITPLTGKPVLGCIIAILNTGLGHGMLSHRSVRMALLQMILEFRITDTLIHAVTTCIEAKIFAAVPTTRNIIGFTFVAKLHNTEALSAVLAEMLLIVRILHAHAVDAVRVGLTAVLAETAVFALLYFIKAHAAGFTEMVIKGRILDTVIAAVTATFLGILPAALLTKTADIADLKTVLDIAAIALLTDHMTVLTMRG